ncbi:hypothetical protein [Methanobacterium sp.]|jgi:hypothetical protein|uniref:hypothetical protein n=1 Tax=Methanobacterium sp. TaxID=2164 RepID=UPI003158CDE5
MPYLVCEKCKGYYVLQAGESPHNFGRCPCGGSLRYVKKLHKRYNQEKSEGKLNICLECGKENINSSKICVFCGKILKSRDTPNICHSCGKENVKTSQVCVFCSNPLKSNYNKRIKWNLVGCSSLALIIVILLFWILH